MEELELSALTGTQSRTYGTRKVTAEMRSAPVHVAIALWDERWDSAPNGKVEGWVIAVNTKKTRFIRKGQLRDGSDIVRATVRELERALKNIKGRVWIVTGRRQVALRAALEKRGYTVTGSFAEENRASSSASSVRSQQARRVARQAKKEGEAPRKKETVAKETPQAHWWPNFSQASSWEDNATVRIATDASSDTVFKGSVCFVAGNGDYRLRTYKTTAGTDELELEALTLALKYLLKVGASKAIIECDSVAALEAVDHIVHRKTAKAKRPGRRWRGLSSGSRSRFQQAWHDIQDSCEVDIRRVMGHSGDPLNRAADQIAYMGLRAIAHPRKQAQATLQRGIAKALERL
ncbi:MAG: RNase H family protein [Corynebacterium camporealensis]|uniref:RNase H family protein n=1 Tax=Corynebacterium camporealensis TaxID=161896 RepID=UPI002A920241|nr:RNase H family protein [Corynebacterium camporealensis]MDY5840226.1 RNase H family protein [Corynebacterium camporealensis]